MTEQVSPDQYFNCQRGASDRSDQSVPNYIQSVSKLETKSQRVKDLHLSLRSDSFKRKKFSHLCP